MVLFPTLVDAHPMDARNAAFVQGVEGVAFWPFLYLGAKHMVTGYDHLLFLVGVIFFLYKLQDVVLYVSLFTLGHSITLLLGVLGGLSVNAYVIDAIIGLVGGLQGVREHGWVRPALRDPAQYEDCRDDLRSVPRSRAGDQAARVHIERRRPGGQHP